ncbi:polysaccharide biosynthesis protein [Chlorobium limicola DSM 245]|uniref:Polysaccharide biosynthesis protein n=2 Tax=Chlorobium limicola TaxID=1092 RepID=B3EF20_CHLL2|nr:polysaccharide biosynthesis protein [Chlorobium limicola DSM 245]
MTAIMDKNETVQKKIAGNALSGMAATSFYLVTRLLLTPFLLSHLTLEEFGLWSLCFIILSYASMGGFGVNSTYIRYTARYHAEAQEEQISRLLSTGIAYMLVFCLIFCTALVISMPLVHHIFHIAAEKRASAATIFIGTAIVFSLELILGGFRFIIAGMHEIAKEKQIATFAGLLEIGAIIVLLLYGFGIMGLLYAYALRVILETLSYRKYAKTKLPHLRISTKLVNREHLKLFFVFGGKVQVLGAGGIFLTALDRLFVTAYLGLASGGLLEIGRKLPFTAKKIAESAFGPFLPAASHLDASWEKEVQNAPATRIRTYGKIALLMFAAGLTPVIFLPSVAEKLPFPSLTAAILSAGAATALFLILKNQRINDEQLKKGELKQLYLNGLRYTNIISSTIFAYLAASAMPLIIAWVGPQYREAAIIMICLSIAYAAQLSTGPGNMIFRGINRNGREFEYMLAQLVLILLWLPAAIKSWALIGAAASLAAASTTSALFFFWRSNYTFQTTFREILGHTLLPALVPLVPASLVYAATSLFPAENRLAAIITILISGTLYLLLTVAMLWIMVLTHDEKQKAGVLLRFTSISRSKNQ